MSNRETITTLKPRFSATVAFEAARPADVERISYGLFEAKNLWDAARNVAKWAAMYRYGNRGETGFVAMVDRNKFRASIGVQRRSNGAHGLTLHGGSIVITLGEEE